MADVIDKFLNGIRGLEPLQLLFALAIAVLVVAAFWSQRVLSTIVREMQQQRKDGLEMLRLQNEALRLQTVIAGRLERTQVELAKQRTRLQQGIEKETAGLA